MDPWLYSFIWDLQETEFHQTWEWTLPIYFDQWVSNRLPFKPITAIDSSFTKLIKKLDFLYMVWYWKFGSYFCWPEPSNMNCKNWCCKWHTFYSLPFLFTYLLWSSNTCCMTVCQLILTFVLSFFLRDAQAHILTIRLNEQWE